MRNNRFSVIFGALFISAALAVPAIAAEGLEAKLQVCGTCHGQEGVPTDKSFPIIWGQQQSFLMKQLHDYRSGDRENPIMKAMLEGFKQEELRPIAAYLASKPWPTKPTPASTGSPTPPNGIALCQICHQQGFVGGPPAPRLQGQSYEYLSQAMRNFADGTRTNNADMVKLMQGLSEAERDAMARYIASL
jgi:cytochrome c553